MSDRVEAVLDLLGWVGVNPARWAEKRDDIKRMIGELGALPVEQSRQFLPGLTFPSNQIIEVPGLPAIAAGATSAGTSVEIKQRGLLVGMWGAVLPDNSQAQRVQVGYQITTDNSRVMVTNGQTGTDESFANMSMFADNGNWVPILWPVMGSGSNVILKFRVSAAAAEDLTPVFNFAFLNVAGMARE